MSDDKSAKAKSYLEWIAPPEGLEALAAGPELLDGVAEAPWTTAEDVERARETIGRLERNEGLSPEDNHMVEAIILPNERPIVDVVDGTYAAPAAPFQHLGEAAARATIEATIPAIGRVELPDHPSLPYGGTGFVVGNGLLMTNRHVAELFASGLGREQLSFIAGQSAAIDFLRERDRAESRQFEIARVVMVHPYWDMALLAVDGLEAVAPLRLSVAEHGDLREREVVVIGYPAADTRNNLDVQNQIFGGVFNVKRLQPGMLRELSEIQSFGHQVSAVTHDSSTLGGNSGSAVIDVQTGAVVGLHFAGRYLEANYAVPTRALALDRRVVEAAVNFDEEISPDGATPWDSFWMQADPAATVAAERPMSANLPLELTIRIDSLPQAQAAGSVGAIEKLVEPFHDEDLSNRRGYDEQFLGVPVPLPQVGDESVVSQLDDGSHVLPYEHFSAVVSKHRRLAFFTASNVDADPLRKEPEPGRDYTRDGLGGLTENDDEKWFTDPRIPAIHQLPNRFFDKDRASFDKGHIVRREDVAWGGTYDEVRRANGDTYHVTNCSPQVASFNRSAKRGHWGLLENLVLRQARSEKYCLFAGPVFRTDDRLFLGVDDVGPVRIPIPRQFWKIVVARTDGGLQTFAFILDQDLSGTNFESLDAVEFTVDRTWKERMISLPDLGELVAPLKFPAELVESDQVDAAPGEAVRAHAAMESYRG